MSTNHDILVEMLQRNYADEGVICVTHAKAVEEIELECYETKIGKGLEKHFVIDWAEDEGIKAMGYTPLFPFALVYVNVDAQKERYKLFVYCSEGSVAIEEIRLARRGAIIMPSDLYQRAKEVRKARTECITESSWYTGVEPSHSCRDYSGSFSA